MDPFKAALGLDQSASREEITRAYRKLALQFHPDKHSHSTASIRDAATLRFKFVSQAYEALLDELIKSNNEYYTSSSRPESDYHSSSNNNNNKRSSNNNYNYNDNGGRSYSYSRSGYQYSSYDLWIIWRHKNLLKFSPLWNSGDLLCLSEDESWDSEIG